VCRKCAYEQFSIHDPDRVEFSEYRYKCAVCEVQFKSNLFFENEDEIQCNNCYLGIETKQENRTRRSEPVKKGVIRVKRKKEE